MLDSLTVARVTKTADDVFTHESFVTDGRRGVRHYMTREDIPHPMPAVELGPSIILTGLFRRAGNTVDIVRKGRPTLSVPMPATWTSIVGYDAKRSTLWATATVDDAPVLLRQRIVLIP
jgi:hypothetical protein